MSEYNPSFIAIEQGKNAFGMGMMGNGFRNKRGDQGQGGLDEANRQEREKMKRNLFIGVDFIGDEEIRIKNQIRSKARC